MAIGESYEDFVAKFDKQKQKTTDDCYTPQNVYEAIRDWAVKEYKLEGRRILRPFYPGGDYREEEYRLGDVVIDNPPFSILAEIKDFYLDRKIDFFLFAPGLTLLSSHRDGVCSIVSDTSITYENGACVKTAFTTNLDRAVLRTAPELRKRIMEAVNANKPNGGGRKRTTYEYPDTLITAASMGKFASAGIEWKIYPDEAQFVRSLDEQKPLKKCIFGGGLILSDTQAKKHTEFLKHWGPPKPGAIKIELSEREKEIQKMLGKKGVNGDI